MDTKDLGNGLMAATGQGWLFEHKRNTVVDSAQNHGTNQATPHRFLTVSCARNVHRLNNTTWTHEAPHRHPDKLCMTV
jgi:hypothetical protein